MPNGASRGTVLPVRVGTPSAASASNCSVATIEVSAPTSETSTNWPRPVCSRWKRAASVPMTAKWGPIMSPNGIPLRTGGAPSSPETVISPLSAWKIVSMPFRPGSAAPKPLIAV